MASILLALACLAIFLLTLIIIFALLPFSALSNKNGIPRDWPILGMFSSLVANFHNIMDWGPKVINHNKAPTFLLKGPWFSSVDLLITMDPANVQYTSSTRFANFRRGTKSRERFDVFGDGLFNSDDKEWMGHRKIHRSFFGNKQFNELSNGLAFDKAEKGVSVVLDHVASGGRLGGGGGVAGVVDLQDLFSRYTYDLTHRLMIGFDPQSLSLLWSQVPFAELKPKVSIDKAISTIMPDIDEEGSILVQPEAILDTRLQRLSNGDPVTEWLIQWKNPDSDEATWEPAAHILSQFPDFQNLGNLKP